jgi:TonB family protein
MVSYGQNAELDITEIVEAQAAYDAKQTNKTRSGLIAALSAYQGEPTIETVNAHLILMINDATAGNDRKLHESAEAAATHLEPVASILPKQFAEARFMAAVGLFNGYFDSDAMIEMAHAEGYARSIRDEAGEQPEWAAALKWKATAWGMAMSAYFESIGEHYPGDAEIDAILADYGYDIEESNEDARLTAGESGLPHCPGALVQRPKMRYPAGGVRRGMFGAVVLSLEFDRDGRVINPEVLASVPLEFFNEKTMRTVGKWRYKADNKADVGISCALERTNVVLPLIFQIG